MDASILPLAIPLLGAASVLAEAARILTSEPGAMELRRLEALQNISGQGNSKVIFDLAKPDGGDSRSRVAGVAAALTKDEPQRIRVNDGQAELAAAAQQASERRAGS